MGGRSCRLFEPRDQIGALSRVGDPREDHRGARNIFLRIGEEAIECLGVPYDSGAPHRRRVIETWHGARAPAEQSAVLRSDAVLGERVTCHALRVSGLSLFRVGLRRSRLRCRQYRAINEQCGGAAPPRQCTHMRFASRNRAEPVPRAPARRSVSIRLRTLPARGSHPARYAGPPSASPRRQGCLPRPWRARGREAPAPHRGRR